MEEDYTKILARYYSQQFEQNAVESMWAIIVDKEKGLYKIDNIPFYGAPFSCGDIVLAEYEVTEEDGEWITYRHVVRRSGNSTIWVEVLDEAIGMPTLRNLFWDMGCSNEGYEGKYFSMEVVVEMDYGPIFQKLSELVNANTIRLAEPVLSEKHAAEKIRR